MSSEVEITQGEEDVYDRQMRLWGVSGQQKIKSSTVLFRGGLRGVGGSTELYAEILKNLCLAGVNLVIENIHESSMEHHHGKKRKKVLEPENASFLMRLLKIRGYASLEEGTVKALKLLNPLCNVKLCSKDELTDSLNGLVITVFNSSLEVSSQLDNLECDRRNVYVFEGFATKIFAFFDFNEHVFSCKSKNGMKGKISCPSISHVTNEIREQLGQASDMKSVPYLAAVAGGIISQEILKVCTGEEQPVMNLLCVDSMECSAMVRELGEVTCIWEESELGKVQKGITVLKNQTQQVCEDLEADEDEVSRDCECGSKQDQLIDLD